MSRGRPQQIKLGEGRVELVAPFCAEDVEKIKDRTCKMWLPEYLFG
jgi:hypothetical protein